MDTNEIDLDSIREAIQLRLLDKIEKNEKSFAESDRDRQAYELLKDYSRRPSKRIRGTLAVLTYEMFGGTIKRDSYDVAAAIELVQNYLLLIDDVVDRSNQRRGRPTAHKIYLDEFSKATLSEEEKTHVSNMLAVHVGLLASHLASEIMSQLAGDAEIVQQATEVFHRNILITCLGQINDLYSTYDHPDEKKLLHNLSRKSSYYTFINPMQIGAVLAGADEKELISINDFGVAAGIAFQLQDDIIGMFGDPSDSGKSNMDDLREGKYTLLIQHLFEKCSEDETRFMKNALGNQSLTVDDANRARQILHDNEIDTYVIDMSRQYAHKAKEILLEQDWPEKYKSVLLQMLKSLENRNQ